MDFVTPRTLISATGSQVPVPDPGRLVHLQFRRFAGCPICNLHLRSFVRRQDELTAAGVTEVVVFHAPADELREHTPDLPFPLIGDPEKKLYAEFGVESAPRALLDPRVWPVILWAVLRGTWQLWRRREPLPARRPHGGRLGLPADFLLAPDGTVLASKLGVHAADHWSVDEVLASARAHGPVAPPASADSSRPAGTTSR